MRFGMIVHTGKPEAVAFGKELVLFRQRECVLTDTSAEVGPHFAAGTWRHGWCCTEDEPCLAQPGWPQVSASLTRYQYGHQACELDADSFEPALSEF